MSESKRVGAPIGNSNARNKRRANHDRIALSLSGDLLDRLYDCLALDGVTADDPHAVKDLAYRVLGAYVRRDQGEAIIL